MFAGGILKTHMADKRTIHGIRDFCKLCFGIVRQFPASGWAATASSAQE